MNLSYKSVQTYSVPDVLTSSDGTRFERASTNAECCSSYSILMTEDGTDWRWPLVTDKGDCHGGMKKTFNEWLDFAVEHKHISGMQNICFEGWMYTMSGMCGIVKNLRLYK